MIMSRAECDGCGKVFSKETIGTNGAVSLTNQIIAAGWHVRRFSSKASMLACSDGCKEIISKAVDKKPTGWSGEGE